jgi:hypothetical protein
VRIGAGKWLHVWRVGSKVLALTFGDVITSKVLSWPFVVHALTHAAYAFIANRCPAVAIPAYSPGGKHWTAHFYIIAIRWRISLRTDDAAAAPSWPSSGPACPPPRLLAPDTPGVLMPSVFARTDGAPAPAAFLLPSHLLTRSTGHKETAKLFFLSFPSARTIIAPSR